MNAKTLQLLASLEHNGLLRVKRIEQVEPVWTSPSNRPDNQWFIFATAADRQLAEDELFLSWAHLDDRSTLLNYAARWRDVQGFGLMVAHAPWAGRDGYVDR